MPRARLLKPGFFANEELAECSFESRLLFAGLWTIADREGRLEDRPKRIKGELFPYEHLDTDALLNELADRGFIVRYTVDEAAFIAIPNFTKHQSPHVREPASTIPAPPLHDASTGPAPGQHQPSPTTPKKGVSESGTNLAPDKHQPSTTHPVAVAVAVADPVTGSGDGSGSGDRAPREPAAAAEESAQRLFRAWESATGTTITRQLGESLDGWLEKLPEVAILKAIAETGNNGAKRWSYTEAILERFQRDGWEVEAKPEPPRAKPAEPTHYRSRRVSEMFPEVTLEHVMAQGNTEEEARAILAGLKRK